MHLIKLIGASILVPLCHLFNLFLMNAYIPVSWQQLYISMAFQI
jgi:hypothetical protein